MPAARTLRDQWEGVAKNAALPDDDPLAVRAAGPLAWLDAVGIAEEDARDYADAVGALEHGLDRDDLTPEELSRLRDRLRRLDRDPPEGLALRARSRASSLEAGRKRRWVTIAAASAAGVALLAAGLAFVTVRLMNNAEEDRLAAEIARLTVAGELVSARTLFDEHAADYDRDEWLAARSGLEDAEAAERTRLSELAAALEAAETAPTPEDALRHIERIRKQQLVRLPDEELKVAKLFKRNTTDLIDEERLLRERFDKSADDVLEEVGLVRDALAADDDAAADAALTRADALLAETVQFAARLPDRADDTRTPMITTQLAALRERLIDKRGFAAAVGRLDGAFASPRPTARVKAYLSAAGLLTTQFPDRPLSRQVAAETAAAQRYWETAAARADGAAQLGGAAPRSAADAAARLERAEALLKLAGSSSLTTAPAIAARLRPAVARARPDGAGGLLKTLREVFEFPLLKDSYTLELKNELKNGGTYHLAAPSTRDGKRVRFMRFISWSLPDPAVLDADDLVTVASPRSPQNLLSAKAGEILRRSETSNWNESLSELAVAIQVEPGLDPFLRWWLLRRTLSDAGEGDLFLTRSLSRLLDDLQSDAIDPSAMWMNPEREDAAPSRQAAERVLAKLSAARIAAAFDDAAKAADRARAAEAFAPTPIGWVAAGPDGVGAVVTPAPGPGRLWVIEPPGPSATAKSDAEARWVRFDPADPHPGRVVFLTPVAVDKPPGLAAAAGTFAFPPIAAR